MKWISMCKPENEFQLSFSNTFMSMCTWEEQEGLHLSSYGKPIYEGKTLSWTAHNVIIMMFSTDITIPTKFRVSRDEMQRNKLITGTTLKHKTKLQG